MHTCVCRSMNMYRDIRINLQAGVGGVQSSQDTEIQILDCIIISDFEPLSCYCIHYHLEKVLNPLFPPNYGLNCSSARMVLALNNPRRLICH